MTQSIIPVGIEVTADTKDANKALDSVAVSVGNVTHSTDEAAKSTDELSALQEQLIQLGKRLNNETKHTTESVDELTKAQKDEAEQTKKLVDQGSIQQLQLFSQTINNLSNTLSQMGLSFSATIEQYKQFETKLAEVSTIAGTTENGLASLETGVRSLATTFGQDAVTQVSALYQTISSGITEASEALKVLGAANKLAVGGATDVFTAIDGLTSIINAYGFKASEATSISDSLFVTMKRGKTTIKELSDGVGNVVAIAHDAGITFDEMAAAIATITLSGKSTQEAITALRGMLVQIISPSKEAADLAEQLGIAFNTGGLKAKGLSGFLADLQEKTQGNITVTSTLFNNVRGLSGVLGLTGGNAKTLASVLADLDKKTGATDEAFEKMNQTLGIATKRLTASFAELQLGIGGALAPTLSKAANSIADFVTQNKTLVTTISGFLVGTTQMGSVLTAVVLGLKLAGPQINNMRVALTAAASSTVAYSGVTAVATLAAKDLAASVWLVTTAFLKSPIGLGIMGAALAFTAMNVHAASASLIQDAKSIDIEVSKLALNIGSMSFNEATKSIDSVSSSLKKIKGSGATQEINNLTLVLEQLRKRQSQVANSAEKLQIEINDLTDQLIPAKEAATSFISSYKGATVDELSTKIKELTARQFQLNNSMYDAQKASEAMVATYDKQVTAQDMVIAKAGDAVAVLNAQKTLQEKVNETAKKTLNISNNQIDADQLQYKKSVDALEISQLIYEQDAINLKAKEAELEALQLLFDQDQGQALLRVKEYQEKQNAVDLSRLKAAASAEEAKQAMLAVDVARLSAIVSKDQLDTNKILNDTIQQTTVAIPQLTEQYNQATNKIKALEQANQNYKASIEASNHSVAKAKDQLALLEAAQQGHIHTQWEAIKGAEQLAAAQQQQADATANLTELQNNHNRNIMLYPEQYRKRIKEATLAVVEATAAVQKLTSARDGESSVIFTSQGGLQALAKARITELDAATGLRHATDAAADGERKLAEAQAEAMGIQQNLVIQHIALETARRNKSQADSEYALASDKQNASTLRTVEYTLEWSDAANKAKDSIDATTGAVKYLTIHQEGQQESAVRQTQNTEEYVDATLKAVAASEALAGTDEILVNTRMALTTSVADLQQMTSGLTIAIHSLTPQHEANTKVVSENELAVKKLKEEEAKLIETYRGKSGDLKTTETQEKEITVAHIQSQAATEKLAKARDVLSVSTDSLTALEKKLSSVQAAESLAVVAREEATLRQIVSLDGLKTRIESIKTSTPALTLEIDNARTAATNSANAFNLYQSNLERSTVAVSLATNQVNELQSAYDRANGSTDEATKVAYTNLGGDEALAKAKETLSVATQQLTNNEKVSAALKEQSYRASLDLADAEKQQEKNRYQLQATTARLVDLAKELQAQADNNLANAQAESSLALKGIEIKKKELQVRQGLAKAMGDEAGANKAGVEISKLEIEVAKRNYESKKQQADITREKIAAKESELAADGSLTAAEEQQISTLKNSVAALDQEAESLKLDVALKQQATDKTSELTASIDAQIAKNQEHAQARDQANQEAAQQNQEIADQQAEIDAAFEDRGRNIAGALEALYQGQEGIIGTYSKAAQAAVAQVRAASKDINVTGNEIAVLSNKASDFLTVPSDAASVAKSKIEELSTALEASQSRMQALNMAFMNVPPTWKSLTKTMQGYEALKESLIQASLAQARLELGSVNAADALSGLQDGLSDGSLSATQYRDRIKELISQYGYLGDERLTGLNDALKSANDQIKSMTSTIESDLISALESANGLIGDTSLEVEKLKYERVVADLEAQRESAAGNGALIEQIDRIARLRSVAHKARIAEIKKESEASKTKVNDTANSAVDNATTTATDANNNTTTQATTNNTSTTNKYIPESVKVIKLQLNGATLTGDQQNVDKFLASLYAAGMVSQ